MDSRGMGGRCAPDAGGGGQPGVIGDFCLGKNGTGAGTIRFCLARPGDRSLVCTWGPGQPGHPDCFTSALVDPIASGNPAGYGGWSDLMAWLAPSLLPAQPGVP